MSSIMALLSELSPNNVTYKNLEDCCYILDGRRKPVTKSARLEGKYPYYGANGIQDYVAEYIFDGTFILVGEDGSVVTPNGTPIVNWAEGKIWVNNHAHIVEEKEGIILRYLYHYLKTIDVHHLIHGNIPKLNQGDFRRLQVAVPPMEVQREIVRVLDSFTLLTAELTAELTARKKQYEFYRNKLLTFDKEIKYKSLEEIAISRCTGGTPLKTNRVFYEGGNIPWLRTQEVVYNEIKSTECFITEEAVQKTSAKWIPMNCVIVAISGASAGRCAINKIPLTTNQHCLNIEINAEIADYKYVYYCICNQYEELVGKKEGARGDLSVARIMSLKIPIPSLGSQKRIVAILNRFDVLCNDLSNGLPAEIEARKKQYEYYRDKLLSF